MVMLMESIKVREKRLKEKYGEDAIEVIDNIVKEFYDDYIEEYYYDDFIEEILIRMFKKYSRAHLFKNLNKKFNNLKDKCIIEFDK